MKKIKYFFTMAGLTGGLAVAVFAGEVPAQDAPPAETNAAAPAQPAPDPAPAAPAQDSTPQPAQDQAAQAAATNAQAATTNAVAAVQDTSTNSTAEFPPDKGLRMNFRNVPLEAVLNYMSKAAGYTIHPKVPVSGTVTAWSDNPLTKEEAVDLLKHVLDDNGYTVLQDGRMLTIISSSEAKRNEIPVIMFHGVDAIPRNTD